MEELALWQFLSLMGKKGKPKKKATRSRGVAPTAPCHGNWYE